MAIPHHVDGSLEKFATNPDLMSLKFCADGMKPVVTAPIPTAKITRQLALPSIKDAMMLKTQFCAQKNLRPRC
jgi:hypothetical protein